MQTSVKLGLLGNGIGRSRARDLHGLLGELTGLVVNYLPMDLAGRDQVMMADELDRCRQEGFRGVNVTHPYKREAFQYVRLVPDFPPGLTAINTVLFEPDYLLAANTDCSGFCRAFRQQFGEDQSPGKVLMLGSGGVGLAIAYALLQLGACELVITDTNPDTAQALLTRLQDAAVPVRLATADLLAEMAEVDGLINATPLGMFQYPGSAFPLSGLAASRARWAFDAVYTPENTEFLAACRERGMATLSGFQLFLYQGLDAYQHFTGMAVDAAVAESAFLQRFPLE